MAVGTETGWDGRIRTCGLSIISRALKPSELRPSVLEFSDSGVARVNGFEPLTPGLEVPCSNSAELNPRIMAGVIGFEPTTFRSVAERSNSVELYPRIMVGPQGIEP